MKSLYESLLDDEQILLDEVEDRVDFYKRTIKYIKDLDKNFHPLNIYSIMVETTWANRDWKQYAVHFCKMYDIKLDDFLKSKKYSSLRGLFEFIQHMSTRGDWFRSSTGSRVQASGLSIELNKVNKYIADKQLEELGQLGLYMSSSNRHNPNIAINCDKWMLYYDEWNMTFYIIWTSKNMSNHEKKVIETMMYQIEKNS